MSDILDEKLSITPRTLLWLTSAIFSLSLILYGIKFAIDEGKQYPKPGTGQYGIDYNDATAAETWPPDRKEIEFKYNALLIEVEKLRERVEKLEEDYENIY